MPFPCRRNGAVSGRVLATGGCCCTNTIAVHRTAIEELFAAADIAIDGSRPWDIRVHNPLFFRRVLADGTLGMGESYMEGWWDCDALDVMSFRAARARLEDLLPGKKRALLAAVLARVGFNPQSRRRARIVGERHYDLGNDFFAAMLDPAMQYSCGYFRGTQDLETAQRQKMDLICRKLGLHAGMRLLDIGCGWGGLARHAAEHWECEVTGVTISREQCVHAQEWCRGLPVDIRLQDYRDVEGHFDRIVSVGMMEHVGTRNYRHYMECAARCLRGDGLFLCHTICGSSTQERADPWITRYIFPNSVLPSATQVARAAEGIFIIEDAHNFGAYYEPTLMAWERNFHAAWPQFRDRYGERFCRMWRYYLLGCAGAFRSRSLQLFQFVLSKEGVLGGYEAVR